MVSRILLTLFIVKVWEWFFTPRLNETKKTKAEIYLHKKDLKIKEYPFSFFLSENHVKLILTTIPPVPFIP